MSDVPRSSGKPVSAPESCIEVECGRSVTQRVAQMLCYVKVTLPCQKDNL